MWLSQWLSGRGNINVFDMPPRKRTSSSTFSPHRQEASRIIQKQVHFSHRIEFAKATHATTSAEISVNVPSNQPSSPNNTANSRTQFELFGRVSKPSGWVVETFERKISFAAQNSSGDAQLDTHFHLALAPGMYRLAIVVKDLASGDTGTLYTAFNVPAYERVATEARYPHVW